MKEVSHDRMNFDEKYDLGVVFMVTKQKEVSTWITDNIGGDTYDIAQNSVIPLHCWSILRDV